MSVRHRRGRGSGGKQNGEDKDGGAPPCFSRSWIQLLVAGYTFYSWCPLPTTPLPPTTLTSSPAPEPSPPVLEDESSLHLGRATKPSSISPPAAPSRALGLQAAKVPTTTEHADVEAYFMWCQNKIKSLSEFGWARKPSVRG